MNSSYEEKKESTGTKLKRIDSSNEIATQLMEEYDSNSKRYLTKEEFMKLADLIVSGYERVVERKSKNIYFFQISDFKVLFFFIFS